jgi:lysine biosynthesis protein LysW
VDDPARECRGDQRSKRPETHCTNCGAILGEDDPLEGALIECAMCGVKLEIVSANPFEVCFPFEKDWEMNGWLIGRGRTGSESTSWDSQRTRRSIAKAVVI